MIEIVKDNLEWIATRGEEVVVRGDIRDLVFLEALQCAESGEELFVLNEDGELSFTFEVVDEDSD